MLMELPGDAPLGVALRDYLSLNDPIIEVDLTPNRGDCFGMRGIAREVGVLTRSAVTDPDCGPVSATIEASVPVDLQDPMAVRATSAE